MNQSSKYAILVSPQLSFLHWLNSLCEADEQLDFSDLDEYSTYYVPHCLCEKEVADYLEKFYLTILKEELKAWVPHPEYWPELKRSLFDSWFHTTIKDHATSLYAVN